MWLYFWTVQRSKNKQKESWIESWNGERTEGHLVLYCHLDVLTLRPGITWAVIWSELEFCTPYFGALLVAQMIKNLPEMQETQIWSLGGEDALEKGMATYSSILSWRIPWSEEPGRLQSMGSQRLDTTEWLTHIHTQSLFLVSLQNTSHYAIKILYQPN